MPAHKTGQDCQCIICGKTFYRRASYIKRGIHKTCGDPACKSASMSGENNPFWGKSHDQETLEMIRKARRSRPDTAKKTGIKPGYRFSPEARAAMAEAQRKRWAENRDRLLAKLAEHRPPPKPREELRYRRNFTRLQRKEWKADHCAWCGSTENLVLDHIIPVSCGGTNERRNAQTLCQPCNVWKMAFVDRPLFLAGLGKNGG